MTLSLLALTFILFGGAAFLMGQAIAETWRPWWQNLAYGCLLAVGDQFLGFALFHGPFFIDSLVSTNAQPAGRRILEYLLDAVVLSPSRCSPTALTKARKMVSQYPWLYERAGLLTWRAKDRRHDRRANGHPVWAGRPAIVRPMPHVTMRATNQEAWRDRIGLEIDTDCSRPGGDENQTIAMRQGVHVCVNLHYALIAAAGSCRRLAQRRPAARQGPDITIATAGPMTGDLRRVRRADEARRRDRPSPTSTPLAASMGKQLKLEVGDDQCDPKQAVAVANDLVSKGVVFVAGHFCSGSSIPASAVYHEEGILQITPASTNPKFTEDPAATGWKTVFRTCGRDDQQGSFAGPWIAEHFKGKNVAIVDDKSAYGKGLADLTKAAMNAAGLKEVVHETITAGEQDYTALVSKLKAAKVDVIYFGGYHPEAALIVKQAREQGLQGPAALGRLAEHAGVRDARRSGRRRRDVHQRRRGAQSAVGQGGGREVPRRRATSRKATR